MTYHARWGGRRPALPGSHRAYSKSASEARGGATLEEIAIELGLTRERVRQIEKLALAKLRRALERGGLGFDDLTGGSGPDGFPEHFEPVDHSAMPAMTAGSSSRGSRRR